LGLRVRMYVEEFVGGVYGMEDSLRCKQILFTLQSEDRNCARIRHNGTASSCWERYLDTKVCAES
jgi:hypothetical protein